MNWQMCQMVQTIKTDPVPALTHEVLRKHIRSHLAEDVDGLKFADNHGAPGDGFQARIEIQERRRQGRLMFKLTLNDDAMEVSSLRMSIESIRESNVWVRCWNSQRLMRGQFRQDRLLQIGNRNIQLPAKPAGGLISVKIAPLAAHQVGQIGRIRND